MEELKRAQEMRIDKISRRRLIGSQDTINELTSPIQELQDQVKFMNDSREFQDVESVRSGRFSRVPSQPAVLPSPRGLRSRDPSLRHDLWNPHGFSGNVLAGPSASASTSYTGVLNPFASDATENILVLTGTRRPVAGNEVHNRDTFEHLDLREDRQPEILSSLWREDL